MKIAVINGPNINFLGIREPEIYGAETYNELCDRIKKYSSNCKIDVDLFQSNREGEIIDYIQSCYNNTDGIIINPAAYTHTSIAIRDALIAVAIPAVEIHISDVDNREPFRRINYIRDICIGHVAGQGTDGYLKAIDMITEYLHENKGE